MPDINLLENTSRPDEKKKKEKEDKFSFDFTHPPKEQKPPEEASAPSSFSLFFKSLFSRKPKINNKPGIVEERIVKKADSAPSPETVTPYIKEENVEDIFEKTNNEESVPASIPTVIPRPRQAFTPAPPSAFTPVPVQKMSPPMPPQENPKKGKKEKEEKSQDHSFLVNLLPEELVGREEPRKKIISLSFIVLGAILLVVLTYIILFFYQKNLVVKTDDAKKERQAIDEQIKGREEEQQRSIELKKRLDSVKSLLANHIYWTKFFEKLEKYTLPDVFYSGGFSASTIGFITLQATAPDFETVSQQLVVLKNAPDFVQDVSITSVRRETASASTTLPEGSVLGSHVAFDIGLNLAADIFIKTQEEIGSSSKTNINTNGNTNASPNENTNSLSGINENLNQNDNNNSNLTPSL